uniref:Uncharacterized protein n=1 Tax=Leersia perrieri TaxID=77586 RepID=A0A0D9V3P7_9ORYZ
MATGELDPVAARQAELAHLPGPKLVDHLCTTHRRADYEAVARVLAARDRSLEAALAEIEDLRRKCDALLDSQRRPPPREELAEEEEKVNPRPAPAPARREDHGGGGKGSEEGEVKDAHFIDLSSDDEVETAGRGAGSTSRAPIREASEDAEGEADEEDNLPLCHYWKKRRRGEPGAVELGKGDSGKSPHNSVDSVGNDPRNCTPARTNVAGSLLTEQMVSSPGDSMVAAFLQSKGTVQPENGGGEKMPRAVLHSPAQVVSSILQKRKFGNKDGPARVPGDTTPSQAGSTRPVTPKKEDASVVQGDIRSSQARSTRLLTPKKEGSSTVPGDTTPSQAGNLSPSATTRRWESDERMIDSLKGNMELTTEAFCALYRRRKLVVKSTEGQLTGLSRIDAFRAIKVAEFLLDGKIQGPLKRTAEELVSYDATGPSFIEKLTLSYSKELFDIYKNKEDPYFCYP